MHHALQVVCGWKGKEWNGEGVVGVVLPSFVVIKKAVDKKHKAQSSASNTKAMSLIKQKARSVCPCCACSQAHACHHQWCCCLNKHNPWKGGLERNKRHVFWGQAIKVKSSECGVVLQWLCKFHCTIIINPVVCQSTTDHLSFVFKAMWFHKNNKPSINNAFSVLFLFNTSPTAIAHLPLNLFPVCCAQSPHDLPITQTPTPPRHFTTNVQHCQCCVVLQSITQRIHTTFPNLVSCCLVHTHITKHGSCKHPQMRGFDKWGSTP